MDDFDFDEAALAALDAAEAQFAASSSAPAPAPPPPPQPAPVPAATPKALTDSLFSLFGYDEFRDGQSEVVEAALRGQDVAVFWATGRGKSICYQFPALHSGRTVVVVSPLISLMTDQVQKLNNTVGRGEREVACFLGSAQLNPAVEAKAFAGGFPLVYMSPEKLMMGGIDRLAAMVQRQQILLFAIDEAHCVSEWGHDFRPDYRTLDQLRQRLPQVPIMALTATAVPDVQHDIVSTLGLRTPLVQRQSSYRSNLAIRCSRKLGGGMAEDLAELLRALKVSPTSTIVYVPTKNDAEKVSEWLNSRGVRADFYHGSRDTKERERVHLAFLAGQLPVVAATVAFGMGIDKPDIRRVVHYGAPKTVEEYYQHIGRAGRDGGPAEVHLIASDNDFARYAGDFYTGQLTAKTKERVVASTNRLREYASDSSTCRWVGVLSMLGETPSFARCGTCDTCKAAQQHAGDLERDFGPVARVVLLAVRDQHIWSAIEKLLNAKSGAVGLPPPVGSIEALRSALQPKRATSTLREFLPLLVGAGFVQRLQKTGGMGRSYDVYNLTPRGHTQLQQLARTPPPPLMLPVPPSVRTADAADAAKASKARAEIDKTRARLRAAGFELSAVPETELEPGAEKTPVTNALLQWARTLEAWRERGMANRADAHEALLRALMGWRADEAMRLRMAPASLLPDHLALKICLVQPTDPDSLIALGARLTADGARGIIRTLSEWRAANAGSGVLLSQGGSQEAASGSSGSAGGSAGGSGADEQDAPMDFPAGNFTPRAAWPMAPPIGGKKPPPWEASYRRFMGGGETIERIALTQESGKSIQPSTVLGHLLTALTHGRPLPLSTLAMQARAKQLAPPSQAEWEQLTNAEAASATDVAKQDKVAQGALLATFLPAAEKEFAERTEADKALMASWYPKCSWFFALRRVGLQPSFAPAAKKVRLA